MLFNLVKKDLILAKKYVILMLIFAIGAPVFIHRNTSILHDGGFLSFFLTAFMTQYILFNMVSLSEAKYKGAALLCATPYTRNALVKAKYLFLFVIFVCCYIIYTTIAVLAPIDMKILNISILGASLLITTIFFGIMLPVQYHFGYEKTAFIFQVLFMTPFFLFPAIAKFLESSNISFQPPAFQPIIQALFPCFLALVIGFVSLIVSIHIYSKKNL